MNYRTSMMAVTAFVAGVVAAGPATRLLPPRLAPNAAFADTVSQSADALRALALFGKALKLVQADYVEPVKTSTLIHYALDGMLGGLDPHSAYMDPDEWHEMQLDTQGHFGGLGMTVTAADGVLKVIAPLDGTPAAQAGIKAGDLITSVDGKTVEGLTLEEAVDKLRGPPGTDVRLTIERHGDTSPIVLTLVRKVIQMQVVTSRRDGDIGYVRLTMFNDDTDRGLRAALAGFRKSGGRLAGLVIDLRNNPGGLLTQAVAVADDFLQGGEIVSTRGRQPADDHAWYAKPGDLSGGIPIVVLINDGSASASEIVAGALQDDGRAVLLGTRSFGKGSVQTLLPLDNGGAIRLTTARYFTPDGRSIQDEGIVPDVVVHAADTPEPGFGPAHESDLNHTLGIAPGEAEKMTRPALAIAAGLADRPPPGWPTYDPDKPATDFQLHQATILLHRMVAASASAGSVGRTAPGPTAARGPG
jgi:carboxyl-terminal processing protease